ncbi:MAG: thioredoxin domain-containing protein, partial [Elusimicrobiota bacterium]
PKVLKKPEALVSLYFPGCTDCDLVAPVLQAVSQDFKGKVDVFRMDASLPENLAILPKGFTAKAYPSFLLYREGSVVSWKAGMPFETRPAGEGVPAESSAEYQGRLGTWFHTALSAG